jgi:branched-chain amino acid transport system ATP-binding protein
MMLEVRGLTKRFGGIIALDGLELHINKGEIVGIIGPNGSGKTTFVNVVTGLYKADRGEVLFEGRPITNKSPLETARLGINRTFQIPRVFPDLSVFENLLALHTSKAISEEEAINTLDLVGLYDKRNQPAKNLTAAERKKLELARALVIKPRLLFLDEPVAGLTLTEMEEVAKLLRQVHREGTTLCIIEHTLKFVFDLVERVIVFHVGKKLAEGKPQEVAEDEKVIEVYIGGKYVAET